MGSVWVAEHRMLKTEVVVKFMADALASDPVSLARFSREAAAAAAVKSPHVVQMLDHGFTPDGTPFIVMELLEGEDLKTRLMRERVISLPELALILSQGCKALSRAHTSGIVHRDIKPENIFLCHTDDGEPFVKLLDFGIAKSGSPTDFHMTQTGVTVGTPFYMSPEQAMGAPPVDATTDLWSLGVVAFEAMTGERPFDGPTLGALTMAICSERPPVPSMVDPAIPTEIDVWMARACARDRADRFQAAKAMSDAFAAALREATEVEASRRKVPLAFEATSLSRGSDRPAPALAPSAPGRLVTPAPQLSPMAPVAAVPPLAASSEPATEPDPEPEPVSTFGSTTSPLSRTQDPHAPAAAPSTGPTLVVLPAPTPRAPYALGGAVLVATALAAWVVLSPHTPSAPPLTVPSAAAPSSTAIAEPVAAPVSPASATPWLPASSVSAAPGSAAAATEAPVPSAKAPPPSTAASPPLRPARPPASSASAPAVPTSPAASAAAPNCNPPFDFDSAHNKVFKKECL